MVDSTLRASLLTSLALLAALSVQNEARAAGLPDDPLKMQAFLVNGRPWTFLSIPGFEILSRADPAITRRRANNILNDIPLQRELVIPRYWRDLPIPIAVILFDLDPDAAETPGVRPTPMQLAPARDSWGGLVDGRISFYQGSRPTFAPDALYFADNVWGIPVPAKPDKTDTGLDEGVGFRFRLEEYRPALPHWFVIGLAGSNGVSSIQAQAHEMYLPTPRWISMGKTEDMVSAAAETHSLPTLLPIQTLFTPESASSKTDSAEWKAEAALFVRWGYFGQDDHGKANKPAFLEFVERAQRSRVTEALFKEYFDVDFAGMDQVLAKYLLDSADGVITVSYEHLASWPPPKPKFDVRKASRSDVARILGDWERLKGNSLKASRPDLSQIYLNQAAQTLNQAYAEGERDPRFLAVLGLYEHDEGKSEAALAHLQAAADAGVIRPEAYLSLAQLRFEAMTLHPERKGGLSAAQVARIVEPLTVALKQGSSDPVAYLLACEAFCSSADPLAAKDFELIEQSASAYPANADVSIAVARFYLKYRLTGAEQAAIDRGLEFAEGGGKDELLKLKASLPVSP